MNTDETQMRQNGLTPRRKGAQPTLFFASFAPLREKMVFPIRGNLRESVA
jgi:hypothetical protein